MNRETLNGLLYDNIERYRATRGITEKIKLITFNQTIKMDV